MRRRPVHPVRTEVPAPVAGRGCSAAPVGRRIAAPTSPSKSTMAYTSTAASPPSLCACPLRSQPGGRCWDRWDRRIHERRPHVPCPLRPHAARPTGGGQARRGRRAGRGVVRRPSEHRCTVPGEHGRAQRCGGGDRAGPDRVRGHVPEEALLILLYDHHVVREELFGDEAGVGADGVGGVHGQHPPTHPPSGRPRSSSSNSGTSLVFAPISRSAITVESVWVAAPSR